MKISFIDTDYLICSVSLRTLITKFTSLWKTRKKANTTKKLFISQQFNFKVVNLYLARFHLQLVTRIKTNEEICNSCSDLNQMFVVELDKKSACSFRLFVFLLIVFLLIWVELHRKNMSVIPFEILRHFLTKNNQLYVNNTYEKRFVAQQLHWIYKHFVHYTNTKSFL